jgi:DNA-binding PadR family transcriptional regulator
MMRGGLIHGRRVVSPLQFLVIMQLSEEPKYGYEMLKVLRDEFDGLWDLKTGTFYPALKSLESRGFVETELRDQTEFYSLTEKGTTLLESLGGRIETEYKVTDKYFKTMMKWMPLSVKRRLIEMVGFMASNPIDIYGDLPKLLKGVPTEKKKEVLENLLVLIRRNLSQVETVYQDVLEKGP